MVLEFVSDLICNDCFGFICFALVRAFVLGKVYPSALRAPSLIKGRSCPEPAHIGTRWLVEGGTI